MFAYFIVKGHSMSPCGGSPVGREPSVKEGDFVFAWKVLFPPRVGDLAVFRIPVSSELFLKRVTNIQDNRYWLEGENKTDSKDSRQLGWVPKEANLGKAYVIHNTGQA